MTGGNWAKFVIVLIGAMVLQVAILDQIVLLDAHPDVLVIIPIAAGLLAGPERGALAGFLSGLLADLFVSLPYGLSPLAFVLAGFAAGLIAGIPGSSPGVSMRAALCAAGAAVATLTYALCAAIIGQKGMLGRELINAIIIVALAALVLAPAVLAALRWSFSGSARTSFGFSVPAGGSATT